MILDYYHGKVVWPPREQDFESGEPNVKVAYTGPDGTEEVMIDVFDTPVARDLEKGDHVLVIDDGEYLDMAVPGIPEEEQREGDFASASRIAEIYRFLTEEEEIEPSHARNMASTVFIERTP